MVDLYTVGVLDIGYPLQGELSFVCLVGCL